MVRTQVQLPDALYERAKRFAEAREISLAEIARRGIETFLDFYPSAEKGRTSWALPRVNVGLKVSPERLRDLSADDETLRALRGDED